jgi:hypothetical protein
MPTKPSAMKLSSRRYHFCIQIGLYSPHAQAFEKSEVRQWNLSFDCLTSVAARARLRNLKETDLEFWKELTSSENPVPSENDPQSEDTVDSGEISVEDDSNVPLGVLLLFAKNLSKHK